MNIVDYRAWDKENKIMIEFDELFFSDMSIVTGHGEGVDYENVDVMPYIGRTDRKGRKIYAGDIYSIMRYGYEEDYYGDTGLYIIRYNTEDCCFEGVTAGGRIIGIKYLIEHSNYYGDIYMEDEQK